MKGVADKTGLKQGAAVLYGLIACFHPGLHACRGLELDFGLYWLKLRNR